MIELPVFPRGNPWSLVDFEVVYHRESPGSPTAYQVRPVENDPVYQWLTRHEYGEEVDMKSIYSHHHDHAVICSHRQRSDDMIRIEDIRDKLPTHPTKRWKRRPVDEILGFVIHHTAGGDDPYKTARYHVGKSHTSASGMPGIAYTFFVQKDGCISWCTDLDARTWSQGGGKIHPDVDGDSVVDRDDGKGNANGRFMAIVLGGSFDSIHNRTGEQPTGVQIAALLALVGHLIGMSELKDAPVGLFECLPYRRFADLWVHSDFGKLACPGDRIGELVGWFRDKPPTQSIKDWQRRLDGKGFSLGAVDGIWGPKSAAALRAFQASVGLEATGERDERTGRALFS